MLIERLKKWKMAIAAEALLCLIALAGIICDRIEIRDSSIATYNTAEDAAREAVSEGYIKWVDFGVSYEALCAAYEWDVKTWGEKVHIDWVEMLAYLGARYGGDFTSHGKRLIEDMDELASKLIDEGMTMEALTKDMEYYAYYEEAYRAVLGGMLGEYEIAQTDEQGNTYWTKVYGLKAYSPIARGFEYSHYADFGSNRNYGYQRQHLGHDMMGQVGTPIIAIESGYVEAIGWNQYGGWRIGIRSFDGRRYYYYAHLRQNYPYAEGLEEGSVVTAGDVIGYMGHTGYSTEENVNNIEVTHLHWGMQLIFDESQKDSNNEIWIDVYPLTQFLYKHRSEAEKVEGTKEWRRTHEMRDPAVEEYKEQHGISDPENETAGTGAADVSGSDSSVSGNGAEDNGN
ncbi:MAG: M23 family metallopeptidase [Lachnospiraceae bacterium]|nr:M23 family metallopeptidase [Lachnospiraceae bacterium]